MPVCKLKLLMKDDQKNFAKRMSLPNEPQHMHFSSFEEITKTFHYNYYYCDTADEILIFRFNRSTLIMTKQ